MAAQMTTASEMVEALRKLDPDTPLGFATEVGEIGGDYHITELKHDRIRSIDCGGRESRWDEANLQLLDGGGEDWLAAGKVADILNRCVKALPELADALLSVEFAHGNRGLSRYTLGGLELRGDRAVVRLLTGVAQCKPAVDAGCRSPRTEAGCCGTAPAKTASASCCG